MLTADTFSLYAYRHYSNPQCIDIDEFYSDLKRFKYLKKQVNRYLESGVLPERLILTHITVIYNLFGIEGGTKLLEYKLDPEHWPTVKPCLVYLNYVRADFLEEVQSDPHVEKLLEKI
jgi:hypothetical protein